MDKKTGTIITIVVAVLTLCCSVTCCGFGIYTIVDEGYTLGIDSPYAVGIPGICLAILAWIVPVLLWVFLVRNKEDGAEGGSEEPAATVIDA
jgi:uncharacterized membrane protein